jgi:BirA family biotin operon repressor/biotin-[acetyl-CoA-carboxylase] ligase
VGQPPFISRRARFERIGSTNDVVRGWLAAGEAEVCLAVADEQTAGRGRSGHVWSAPPGHGLLLTAGFRPTYLAADQAWRLAATVSLAMTEAAETVAGLAAGTIRLKWPNDLVVEADGAVRKLAGVLGETEALGSADPRAVVGIGINADWPAADFPPGLADAMTSLSEVAGRSVDGKGLLDAFLVRLEARHTDLREGAFDVAAWTARQLTDGRHVRLDLPDGASTVVLALGVDPASGGLRVAAEPGGPERTVLTGEIEHLRLAAAPSGADRSPTPPPARV